MVFNSFGFFPFFLFVLVSYFLLKSWVLKKSLLVVASYVFYALFNPWYVLLLAGGTFVTWLAAEFVCKYPAHRVLWLSLGVGLPLAALGYFKYTAFFLDNIDWVYNYWGMERPWSIITLALPAGLSFYLFHSISYLVDVYRGSPRASPLDYALYVAFFPQLVAGPIVRRGHFIPQAEDRSIGAPDWSKISWGLTLFAVGLFQKVVLADNVFANTAEVAFSATGPLSMRDAWLGIMAFTGQIYFDFSGYSTCAIGISLCFGFRLPMNFNNPYAAIGFSDFWRRWHISLSSWLRDYLYIPLGGNRGGTLLTYRNLMLTMLLGGLWHGSAWTFVIWGGLHGLFLAAERAVQGFSVDRRYWRTVGWLLTLLSVMIAWVFFRATSVGSAVHILSAAFSPGSGHANRVDDTSAILVVGSFSAMLAYSLFMRHRSFPEVWCALPRPAQGLMLAGCIVMASIWRGEPREFIYFAF